MQAIILAGGQGTRLRSVVSDVPKPLAPVAGKPFLCWLLPYLKQQGVNEAVIAVHHQAKKIEAVLGKHYAGIELRYSHEETPLGTGGAVKKALSMTRRDAPVWVMNGDSLMMLDYAAMLATHKKSGRKATLAVRDMPTTDRYSKLMLKDGLIVDYQLRGDAQAGIISAGLYILEPDIFERRDLPEIFSIEKDFYAPFVPELKPAAYNKVDYFIDIGVPADYARAEKEIPARLAV